MGAFIVVLGDICAACYVFRFCCFLGFILFFSLFVYFSAKVINAENAAHKSEKFRTMAQRTRQEYLKDLAINYVTSNTLDSGSKLSEYYLLFIKNLLWDCVFALTDSYLIHVFLFSSYYISLMIID